MQEQELFVADRNQLIRFFDSCIALLKSNELEKLEYQLTGIHTNISTSQPCKRGKEAMPILQGEEWARHLEKIQKDVSLLMDKNISQK